MAKAKKTVGGRSKRRSLKIKVNAKTRCLKDIATLRLALDRSEELRQRAETTLATYKQAVRLPLTPTPDTPPPPGREYVAEGVSNDDLLGLNSSSVAGFAHDAGQLPEIYPTRTASIGVASASLFAPEQYVYASTFARLVDEELTRARAVHGDRQSNLHESYAVLLEEVDEFWDEIKARVPDRARVVKELVQVAAMARRCAEDVLGIGFE